MSQELENSKMEARFINEEGQSIHDGLGRGSSTLTADQTRFTHVAPYRLVGPSDRRQSVAMTANEN